MIIKGANLGTKDVTIKPLTKYDWSDDLKIMNIIKMIENMYISCFNVETNTNQMQIDRNGNVIIEKGMTNHRCSCDIECLRTISKYGILASEWFGEIESEREGCFCTFISRMKGNDYKGGLGDLAEDDNSRLNIGKNIVLFFDDSNEIMKKLIHLDFFEYEHIKSLDISKISELYTEEEIKILDFIEKISPAGKNMRKSSDFKTNYWSAIPGGIPPFLINGICIKNNVYSEKQLDEINSLFPNALIFDSRKKVIRVPLNKHNNKSL